MLALAPTPIQQSIQFHSQPSSSVPRPSRSTSRRSSSNNSTTTTNTLSSSSSSSSSTLTASSTARSSHREGPSSPRRTLSSHSSSSHTHPAPARPNGDGGHHPPPASAPVEGPPVFTRPAPPDAPPVDIHAYDAQELLRLLASLLAQIATTNDGLTGRDPHLAQTLHPPAPASPLLESHHPPIWRTLTTASRGALSSNMSLTFHARNVPTITLESYLLRILRYCPASNEVFLSLLVYFDRMSKLAKEACGKDFVIDSYNIHRLVIAGVTVASKFFSDVFYTNSRYAKVGGLPQAELNQLELQFLLLNDFRLMISREEMQRYAEQLIHFSRQQSQQQSQAQSPSSPHTEFPPPPAGPSHHAPSGPAKFMSAVDGYGARTPQVHPVPAPPPPPPQQEPEGYPYANQRAAFRRSTSSDAASVASTDADGSTDDEPTIRPADADAVSLRSEGSIFGGEGEYEGDDDDEDGDGRRGGGVVGGFSVRPSASRESSMDSERGGWRGEERVGGRDRDYRMMSP